MDATPPPQAQPPAQPQKAAGASRICQIHGIVLGPFGRCVICQRAESDEPDDPGGGRRAASALIALAVALGGVLVYKGVSGTRAREEPVVTSPPVTPLEAAAAQADAEAQEAAARAADARAAARVKAINEEKQRVFEAALRKVPVNLYTAKTCETCGAARDWLKSKQIAFTDVDAEATPEARAALRAQNPRFTVPTFVVDGEVFVGFAPDAIQGALLRAAQKRIR